MEQNFNEKNNSTASTINLFAANQKMIATNDRAYDNRGFSTKSYEKIKTYSNQEIADIIASGSPELQQKLSRNYFYKDGYYKQIIIHYATLLTYMGLLIPHPKMGQKLSNSHIQKRYNQALDYIENSNLPVQCSNFALRALIDGSYFGILVDGGKNNFNVIDLPSGYAWSRFKDQFGRDIVEFDVTYFDLIRDKQSRKEALSIYPKIVRLAYGKYSKGDIHSRWVQLPPDLSVCFPFFDGRPLFLSVIPATIQYDEAVGIERTRAKEEIHKILIQKIPHLNDGRLLFEPDEAAEIHQGAVGMMKHNENTNVLTTYGDVTVADSRTSADNSANTLSKIENNIFAQAGVSKEIFSASGSGTVETSLTNDLAMMMHLANKISTFITHLLNSKFSNGSVNFKYSILPISYHNQHTYLDAGYKLATMGYSALLPALAQGLNQRDIVDLKDLENDTLKLGERLKPLSSAYTQSNSDSKSEQDGNQDGNARDVSSPKWIDEGGRPKMSESNKSEQTIKNDQAANNTGGAR